MTIKKDTRRKRWDQIVDKTICLKQVSSSCCKQNMKHKWPLGLTRKQTVLFEAPFKGQRVYWNQLPGATLFAPLLGWLFKIKQKMRAPRFWPWPLGLDTSSLVSVSLLPIPLRPWAEMPNERIAGRRVLPVPHHFAGFVGIDPINLGKPQRAHRAAHRFGGKTDSPCRSFTCKIPLFGCWNEF